MSYPTIRRYLAWRLSCGVRVGRLDFHREIRWLGPCHTYVLWPRWVKLERENW